MPRSIAQENRIRLETANKAKMVNRNEGSTYHRSRFMPENFIFKKDEVVLHVVGTATSYSIFVEDYDRNVVRYDFNGSDLPEDVPLEDVESNIDVKQLDIYQAKKIFHSLDHYYFGHCIPRTELQFFTNNFTRLMKLNEFTNTINAAFSRFLENDKPAEKQLSLFEKETRISIDKKNKYGEWLEKWDTREARDFRRSIEKPEAQKTLQLLKSYLSGGATKRFFAGKWRHHYCEEIEALLKPYLAVGTLEDGESITLLRTKERNSPSEMLDRSNLEDSFSLQNRSKVTVEAILRELKNRIARNTQSSLKLHGDLYALLQVIYDKTGINYFELDEQPAPNLDNDGFRF